VIWYLEDLSRLKAERSAIEELVAAADWLSDVRWSFGEEIRLVLRFTITIGSRRYELKMTYPEFFPATPPTVAPVDPGLRISSHQYGAGGDLCLEYRPDNWEPRFTGADLVRSAHRLISTEHPADGEPQRVRSAHAVTRGQQLRSTWSRFLVTADLREQIGRLPECVPCRCEVRLISRQSSMSAFVGKLVLPDGSDWVPREIPNLGYVYRGILLRIGAPDLAEIVNDKSRIKARQLRDAYAQVPSPPLTAYRDNEFVVATDGFDIRMFWQLSEQKDDVSLLPSLDIDDDRPRLPATHAILAEKKVAVIGCGSVGSKIAASFARSGVGNFLLVDDDVFIRKNLQRNELDWRAMGEHKVEALSLRVRRLNPAASVNFKRFRLGGQEAPGSTSALLSEIGNYDLIVDATAESRAFNLLSAVAATAKKPMVWCEVFAGGIGGFVARSRPGIDHPPQTMRAILLSWSRDQGVKWEGAANEYDAEDPNGAPLIADDGDVSVIAAHAARMGVDLLLGGNIFPHSMYVIGLKGGWKFEEPFEAYPIRGTEPFVPDAAPTISEEDRKEAAEFLVDLIKAPPDETPAAG
jgi:sulfur-carrier protein adenylyltransferase/sulfurtransferase